MYVTSEQIRSAGKANMEAFLSLATTQFAAIEKFANLNANVIKSAFETSIASARALAGARTVRELLKVQSSLAQPAMEKALPNPAKARSSAKRRPVKKAAARKSRKSR